MKFEDHVQRDKTVAGLRLGYPEVHLFMDQFAHWPDDRFLAEHRKFLHHEEGIAYVRMRWGEEAALAARQHVLDDCGHVPHAVDYYIGAVDNYGQQKMRA